jgi:uncharacterized coiled-coil protein SlyX
MMEVQKKETGQVFWACRSCMNFASSITTKVQEVDRKVEELRGQVAENKEGVDKANENVRKMEKKVEKVEKKMEDGQQRMEDIMYEEMRAREAIRRNVVIYGVEEPSTSIRTDKERIEADMAECEKIFKATKANLKKRDIRFCRRIGEKGTEKRPMLVGMTSEQVKTELLDAARELQHTAYKNISIGPDQTRKQRQAEKKLQEEVERKNREELSEEDLSKNLKWQAVGRKGEKRIVKAPERERTWGEGPSSHHTLGRGRGRGGAGPSWRRQEQEETEYNRDSQGSQTGGRGKGRGARQNWRRQGQEGMDLDMEDDGTQKRNRGVESESEEETEPPRHRARQ